MTVVVAVVLILCGLGVGWWCVCCPHRAPTEDRVAGDDSEHVGTGDHVLSDGSHGVNLDGAAPSGDGGGDGDDLCPTIMIDAGDSCADNVSSRTTPRGDVVSAGDENSFRKGAWKTVRSPPHPGRAEMLKYKVVESPSRGGLFRVVDLGKVTARARQKLEHVLVLPVQGECAPPFQASFESEVAGVSVVATRAVQGGVAVQLSVAAPRSGSGALKVRIVGQGNDSVVGKGTIEVTQAAPTASIALEGIVGELTQLTVAIGERMRGCRYSARFEPSAEDMWVEPERGVVSAGAAEYPFLLCWQPQAAGEFAALLVVDLGDGERTYELRGMARDDGKGS